MTRANRIISMHQSVVVGVIACKTLETRLLLKKESLLVLVTYLDEGRAGVEIMVVAAIEADGML